MIRALKWGRGGPIGRFLLLAALLALLAGCSDSAADEEIDGLQLGGDNGGDAGLDPDMADDSGTGDLTSTLTPPSSTQFGLAANSGQTASQNYQLVYRVGPTPVGSNDGAFQIRGMQLTPPSPVAGGGE